MNVEQINAKLLLYYGKNVNCDKPNYRVVWSTGLTERRRGEFIVHDAHGNRRGSEVGVREVLKYPLYQDRWVFERLFPNPNQDEVVGDYTYEPVWVFEDEQGNAQPLWVEAVMFVARQAAMPEIQRRTQAEVDRIEAERMEKEQQNTKDFIDNEYPDTIDRIHDGEGVVISDTKMWSDKNGNSGTSH
jgi:hypothetical protein